MKSLIATTLLVVLTLLAPLQLAAQNRLNQTEYDMIVAFLDMNKLEDLGWTGEENIRNLNPDALTRIIPDTQTEIAAVPEDFFRNTAFTFGFSRDGEARLTRFKALASRVSFSQWLLEADGTDRFAATGDRLRFPEGFFAAFPFLQEINLSRANLQTLPTGIGRLTELSILNISQNPITELPSELASLTNLQVLNISKTTIHTLPPWIVQSPSLLELFASSSDLKKIPSPFSDAFKKNIKRLHFDGNTPLRPNTFTDLANWDSLSDLIELFVPAQQQENCLVELKDTRTLVEEYDEVIDTLPFGSEPRSYNGSEVDARIRGVFDVEDLPDQQVTLLKIGNAKKYEQLRNQMDIVSIQFFHPAHQYRKFYTPRKNLAQNNIAPRTSVFDKSSCPAPLSLFIPPAKDISFEVPSRSIAVGESVTGSIKINNSPYTTELNNILIANMELGVSDTSIAKVVGNKLIGSKPGIVDFILKTGRDYIPVSIEVLPAPPTPVFNAESLTGNIIAQRKQLHKVHVAADGVKKLYVGSNFQTNFRDIPLKLGLAGSNDPEDFAEVSFTTSHRRINIQINRQPSFADSDNMQHQYNMRIFGRPLNNLDSVDVYVRFEGENAKTSDDMIRVFFVYAPLAKMKFKGLELVDPAGSFFNRNAGGNRIYFDFGHVTPYLTDVRFKASTFATDNSVTSVPKDGWLSEEQLLSKEQSILFNINALGSFTFTVEFKLFGDPTTYSHTQLATALGGNTDITSFTPRIFRQDKLTNFNYTLSPRRTVTSGIPWNITQNGENANEDFWLLDNGTTRQLVAYKKGKYQISTILPSTGESRSFDIEVFGPKDSCVLRMPARYTFPGSYSLIPDIIPEDSPLDPQSFTITQEFYDRFTDRLINVNTTRSIKVQQKINGYMRLYAEHDNGLKCTTTYGDDPDLDRMEVYHTFESVGEQEDFILSANRSVFFFPLQATPDFRAFHTPPKFEFEVKDRDGNKLPPEDVIESHTHGFINQRTLSLELRNALFQLPGYVNRSSFERFYQVPNFKSTLTFLLKQQFKGNYLEITTKIINPKTNEMVDQGTLFIIPPPEKHKHMFQLSQNLPANQQESNANIPIYLSDEEVNISLETQDPNEVFYKYYLTFEGRRIQEGDLTKLNNKISLKNLAPGSYSITSFAYNQIGEGRPGAEKFSGQTTEFHILEAFEISLTAPVEVKSGESYSLQWEYNAKIPRVYEKVTLSASLDGQKHPLDIFRTRRREVSVQGTRAVDRPKELNHFIEMAFLPQINNLNKPAVTIVRPDIVRIDINTPPRMIAGNSYLIRADIYPQGAWIKELHLLGVYRRDNSRLATSISYRGSFQYFIYFPESGEFTIRFEDVNTGRIYSKTITVQPGLKSINLPKEIIAKANERVDLRDFTQLDPEEVGFEGIEWEIIGESYGSNIQNGILTVGDIDQNEGRALRIRALKIGRNPIFSNIAFVRSRPIAQSIRLEITNPSESPYKGYYDTYNTDFIELTASISPFEASRQDLEWEIISGARGTLLFPNSFNSAILEPVKGDMNDILVRVTTQDDPSVYAEIRIKLRLYPKSLSFTLPPRMIKDLDYGYRLSISPRVGTNEIRWSGDEDFSRTPFSFTGHKLGRHTIEAEHLYGLPGQQLTVSQTVTVYDKTASLNLSASPQVLLGENINYSTRILPATAYQSPKIRVRSSSRLFPSGEARLEEDGRITTQKPGWVQISASTPVLHESLLPQVVNANTAILAPQSDFKLNILPNQESDTIVIFQKSDDFIFEVLPNSEDYFSLKLRYVDQSGETYNVSRNFVSSSTIQAAGAFRSGFVEFTVSSTIAENYVYLRDTLFIQPNEDKISYDTLIVNQVKLYELEDDEELRIASEQNGITLKQAGLTEKPAMVGATTTGDYVAWRIVAGSSPTEYTQDAVLAVDSVHIVKGITNLELRADKRIRLGDEVDVEVISITSDFKEAFEFIVNPLPKSQKRIDLYNFKFEPGAIGIYTITVRATDGSRYEKSVEVEVFEPLTNFEIGGNIKHRDTLLVGELRPLQALLVPENAFMEALVWNFDASKVSISDANSETPVVEAIAPTYNDSYTKIELAAQDATLGVAPGILDLHIIQLVEGVRTDFPETVYIGKDPVTFLAEVTEVLPTNPQPNKTAITWSTEQAGISIKDLVAGEPNRAGHEIEVRIEQPGTYRIEGLTAAPSTYLYEHTLNVVPVVTEVNLAVEKETVFLRDKTESMQCEAQYDQQAIAPKIKWSIQDIDGNAVSKSIASIDENGLLEVHQSSLSQIVVKLVVENQLATNNRLEALKTIDIKQYVTSIELTDIVVGAEPDFLYQGQSENIIAKVLPENAFNKELSWRLEGNDPVLLQENTQTTSSIDLTSVGSGEVFLIATAKDGSNTELVKPIEARIRAERILHNVPDSLLEGQEFQLQVALAPQGAVIDKVRYSLLYWDGQRLSEFTDASIASVSSSGLLKMELRDEVITKVFYVQIETEDIYGNKLNLINPSLFLTLESLKDLKGTRVEYLNRVDELFLSTESQRIYVGQTTKLTTDIVPEYADIDSVEWFPRFTGLFSFDILNKNQMELTGVSQGARLVYSGALDGSEVESNRILIEVVQQLTDFSLTDYKIVYKGDELNYQLENLTPSNGEQKIKWTLTSLDGLNASDPRVVSFDEANQTVYIGAEARGRFELKAETQYGFEDLVRTDIFEVHQQVENIKLEGDFYVPVGSVNTYTASLSPSNPAPTEPRVNWSISYGEVAGELANLQDLSVQFTAKEVGQTGLTATAVDGKAVSITQNIKVYAPATSIDLRLSGLSENLFVGRSKQIIVDPTPRNADPNYVYTQLSGEEFVMHSDNIITGLQVGQSIIEVLADDDNQATAQIVVNVIRPVTELRVEAPELVEVGTAFKLETFVNEDATIKDLIFVSTNDVGVVSPEGVVLAKKNGTMNLLVMTTDGSFLQKTVQVEVVTPISRFEVNYKGVDKIFQNSVNLGAIKGRRFVSKDSIQIEITAFPEDASNKDFSISFSEGAELLFSGERQLSENTKAIDLYALEPKSPEIYITSNDLKGHKDTIELDIVNWVEEINLSTVRPVMPLLGTETVYPNFLNGVLPEDAANKAIRFTVSDPFMAKVDRFGNLTAKNKLGRFTVYGHAVDGSGMKDSIEINVINPALRLSIADDKNIMPVGYQDQLIVTSFPEGLLYTLTVEKDHGSILPGDIYQSPDYPTDVTIRGEAEYFGIPLKATIDLEVSRQTFFIIQDTITLRQGQESYLDYENYASQVFWSVKQATTPDSAISLVDDGIVTALNYGTAKVFGQNEQGSKDSAIVNVLLPILNVSQDLVLYPNPNTEQWINVQAGNMEGKLSYKVYGNVNGMLYKQGTSNSKTFRVNFPNNMQSGVYTMVVEDEIGNTARGFFIVILE